MSDSSPQTDPAGATSRLQRLLGYLATDPENLPLRADAFDVALMLGALDVAEQQTTWVLTRVPQDFGWRHRMALVGMAKERWEEAALLLQSLIDEGQSDPVVAYNLAYVQFATGRDADAATRLRPLVAAHLESAPQSLALLLRCLHRMGAVEEALEVFGRHVDRAPSADAFGVAGLIALDADDPSRALAWATRALNMNEQQHEALVALGTALLGENDAEGARGLLLKASAQRPEDGRTLSALAMAQMMGSDFEGAHKSFVQAVRFMPSHIGTWLGLGWCEVFRRDFAAAQIAFEEALRLDRNFGESHGALAVAEALQGRSEQAESAIRRALKLDPGGLSARYAQAVLSGDVADSWKFMGVARTALERHRDARGRSLAELVLQKRGQSHRRP